MRERPTVLVMMSSYNGSRYIEQQIDSILAQEGDFALFLHVRDDGSSDGTQEILERYAAEHANVSWEQGENLGSTLSFMNLLYHAGDYDYYAFSDQDDVWLSDKIQSALEALQAETGPALYSCMKTIVDEKLNPLPLKDTQPKPGFLNAFFLNNSVSGCTMVLNRPFYKILSKIKFDWGKVYHDSWAYKVAEIFGKNIFDRTPHMLYRQHGNNVLGAGVRGWKLFLSKLKKLPSYRTEEHRYTSIYARYIVEQDAVPIPYAYRDVLGKIASEHHTFLDNIFILRFGGLSKTPVYEYIWRVYQILSGRY